MGSSKLWMIALAWLMVPVGGPAVSCLRATEKAADLDEEILRQSHIGTDGASLLEFLRKRSPASIDLQDLHVLVRQLGSDSFDEREKASRQLTSVGWPAVAVLRHALKDPDAEVAGRAKACLTNIERDTPWGLPCVAVRRLVELRPAGTVAVLVRYLPYAVDETTTEAIWYGLDALAARDAKVRAELASALKDGAPARRAVAACILGRRGNADQHAGVRRLLNDPDATVRLRAAQGLLAAQDRAAIPTLIGLMEGTSTQVAWQAEELLHWVAGDEAPGCSVGAGSPEARKQCRAGWRRWWQAKGPKVDPATWFASNRRPGLLLILESNDSDRDKSDRVWLCGCDAKPRWECAKLKGIHQVQFLPADRFLTTEFYQEKRKAPFVGFIRERDLDGRVLWHKAMKDPRLICQALPNGHRFIATRGRLLEYTGDGKEVFAYRQDSQTDTPSAACEMGTGRIVCTYGGEGGKPPVIAQFDVATGQEVSSLRLQSDHGSYLYPRITVLPGGRFAIVVQDGRTVSEFDLAGSVTRRDVLPPNAYYQARLPNGNTLATSRGSAPQRVAEIDPAGKVVWEAFTDSEELSASVCMGLVRLGFDRPRLAGLDLDSDAYRLDSLRARDVYLRRYSAQALIRAGPRPKAVVGALIEALGDPDGLVREAAVSALGAMGPAAIAEIARGLKHKSPRVRALCARCMGCDWPEAIAALPALLEALKDDEPQVRQSVIDALHYIPNKAEEVVPLLAGALRDPAPGVRESAARELGHMGPRARAAVPALLQALAGKDASLRCHAGIALVEVAPSDPRVYPRLLKILGSRAPLGDRAAAALAIAYLGRDARSAVPALIELVQTKDPKNLAATSGAHVWAAMALGSIGPDAKAAVPALIKMLKDDTRPFDERSHVMNAIGGIGEQAKLAVPAFLAILADKNRSTRERYLVATTLPRLGAAARDAIPTLKEFMACNDPLLRILAAQALNKIGDSR